MLEDLLNQVQSFFAEKTQWDSFLELHQNKDAIRNAWFGKLKEALNRYFSKNPVDKWEYASWGLWDYRWFLKDYGHDSLCLWFRQWGQYFSLSLWANQNVHDVEKISSLLQTEKYALIISAFDRQDEILWPNQADKILEHGNFSFNGDPMTGHFTLDKLAWYANYRTDDLAQQIIDKVERFRNNEEITNLLMEINAETKK